MKNCIKKNIKKLSAVFLFAAFLNIQIMPAYSIQGHVQVDEGKAGVNKEIFTGEHEVLKEKSTINLTVSQVLSSGYTIEGDEFFAEVTQDVESDKGVIIPTGTIVHGIVNCIQDPKNMGRDGYIDVKFDYMVTPDGSQIPIEATLSTKDPVVKGVAKTVAHHAGYTLLGGVAGGFLALNTMGLGAAVASNGITLGAGAAVGGAVGLTMAIIKKGKGFNLTPGDELKIKLSNELDMPVYTKDAFRQEEIFLEGLDVKINDIKFEKDPFGIENTITINLGVNNYTDYTFSTFDIALVSNTSQVFFASPFGDTSLWFRTISPGDRVLGKLSFSVSDKKANHWLVFYDRKTKKELAKYSLHNAKTDLKYNSKKKGKSKKKQA